MDPNVCMLRIMESIWAGDCDDDSNEELTENIANYNAWTRSGGFAAKVRIADDGVRARDGRELYVNRITRSVAGWHVVAPSGEWARIGDVQAVWMTHASAWAGVA